MNYGFLPQPNENLLACLELTWTELCESIVVLLGIDEKLLRRKFNSWDFTSDDERYMREGNEKHIFRVMLDRIPFKMDYLFEYLFKESAEDELGKVLRGRFFMKVGESGTDDVFLHFVELLKRDILIHAIDRRLDELDELSSKTEDLLQSLDDTRKYQITGIQSSHRFIAEKWCEELTNERKYYVASLKSASEGLSRNQSFTSEVISTN